MWEERGRSVWKCVEWVSGRGESMYRVGGSKWRDEGV